MSEDNEFEADAPYERVVNPVDGADPDQAEANPVERDELPPAPETGDPRVDQVLHGLAALDTLPTAEHVGVYDGVHRGLQDALANLDQG